MTFTRPLRAAIVDLDGTLVDTVSDFAAALSSMLAEIGHPGVDADFVRRTVGKGSAYLVRAALAQAAADPGAFDAALARYQHHYRAINGRHSSVYPGVVEGLDALAARGFKLACLTNKPHAFALELLRRKDLSRHFEHVFGGDSFARGKPDPLPVTLTCAALGTEPAATLVIGDSINDVQAARGAGCPVVLVSYGYNHGLPAAEAGADAVFDRIDEIDWPRGQGAGQASPSG
jgi:phosphoglycolate phosphatase